MARDWNVPLMSWVYYGKIEDEQVWFGLRLFLVLTWQRMVDSHPKASIRENGRYLAKWECKHLQMSSTRWWWEKSSARKHATLIVVFMLRGVLNIENTRLSKQLAQWLNARNVIRINLNLNWTGNRNWSWLLLMLDIWANIWEVGI